MVGDETDPITRLPNGIATNAAIAENISPTDTAERASSCKARPMTARSGAISATTTHCNTAA